MKFLVPLLISTVCWIILLFDLDFSDFSRDVYPNLPFQNEVYQFQPTDTNYSVAKQQVLAARQQAKLNQISSDSLSSLFTLLLTQKIIPHWLTTPWSFEGHTAIPRQGEIACGYFVSTTLKDMGFNLNRYTFAQQLPINEAKTLNLGEPVMTISSSSTEERISQLDASLKEGIYFIGFDRSHVGYIQKKDGQLFVIHSNYINAEGVVIERVEASAVFSTYQTLYIAEISTNEALLQKWLLQEPITVVTQ
jgi:hypothetical protein